MRRFTPDEELSQAKWYKALASKLERRQSTDLSELFSILAALAEEKALILKQIDELRGPGSHDIHAARVHRDFLEWSAAHFEAKERRSKHH